MRLDRFIAKSRIIELESRQLREAYEELLLVSTFRSSEEFDRPALVETLVDRERAMTTYLGNGVALPHLRLKLKRPYIFAIGWCRGGLDDPQVPDFRQVRLVLLLLANEGDKNYLSVLAALARLFREQSLVEHIQASKNLEEFQERVFLAFGGLMAKPERRQNRINRMFLKQAERLARFTKSSALLIFSDTFAGGIDLTEHRPDYPTVLITRAAPDRLPARHQVAATIEVRSFAKQRLSQLRSAVVIGLTRGVFKYTDRLCCVGGVPNSNQLDTLCVIDVNREFQSVLTRETELLPASVKVEVIERMLAIAAELAVEGREGRPVGCLFVIGDHENVAKLVKPLVLNPFYGYRPEDRNVLNPFMDETVKELSSIDGAFVVRGDGVIESAGSLIHAPSEFYRDLPGGFGSRHAAAAAISRATDCVAVVVSASTGQVTLFRHGVMLPLVDKNNGGYA